jgi:hypothetical protein
VAQIALSSNISGHRTGLTTDEKHYWKVTQMCLLVIYGCSGYEAIKFVAVWDSARLRCFIEMHCLNLYMIKVVPLFERDY